MRDDYFKTLGIIMCVMYAFSSILSLSFVIDKNIPFLQTIPPVLSFVNLSLGVSFIVVSLLFIVMSLRAKFKKNRK